MCLQWDYTSNIKREADPNSSLDLLCLYDALCKLYLFTICLPLILDLYTSEGLRFYSPATSGSNVTMNEACARTDNRSPGEYELLIKKCKKVYSSECSCLLHPMLVHVCFCFRVKFRIKAWNYYKVFKITNIDILAFHFVNQ